MPSQDSMSSAHHPNRVAAVNGHVNDEQGQANSRGAMQAPARGQAQASSTSLQRVPSARLRLPPMHNSTSQALVRGAATGSHQSGTDMQHRGAAAVAGALAGMVAAAPIHINPTVTLPTPATAPTTSAAAAVYSDHTTTSTYAAAAARPSSGIRRMPSPRYAQPEPPTSYPATTPAHAATLHTPQSMARHQSGGPQRNSSLPPRPPATGHFAPVQQTNLVPGQPVLVQQPATSNPTRQRPASAHRAVQPRTQLPIQPPTQLPIQPHTQPPIQPQPQFYDVLQHTGCSHRQHFSLPWSQSPVTHLQSPAAIPVHVPPPVPFPQQADSTASLSADRHSIVAHGMPSRLTGGAASIAAEQSTGSATRQQHEQTSAELVSDSSRPPALSLYQVSCHADASGIIEQQLPQAAPSEGHHPLSPFAAVPSDAKQGTASNGGPSSYTTGHHASSSSAYDSSSTCHDRVSSSSASLNRNNNSNPMGHDRCSTSNVSCNRSSNSSSSTVLASMEVCEGMAVSPSSPARFRRHLGAGLPRPALDGAVSNSSGQLQLSPGASSPRSNPRHRPLLAPRNQVLQPTPLGNSACLSETNEEWTINVSQANIATASTGCNGRSALRQTSTVHPQHLLDTSTEQPAAHAGMAEHVPIASESDDAWAYAGMQTNAARSHFGPSGHTYGHSTTQTPAPPVTQLVETHERSQRAAPAGAHTPPSVSVECDHTSSSVPGVRAEHHPHERGGLFETILFGGNGTGWQQHSYVQQHSLQQPAYSEPWHVPGAHHGLAAAAQGADLSSGHVSHAQQGLYTSAQSAHPPPGYLATAPQGVHDHSGSEDRHALVSDQDDDTAGARRHSQDGIPSRECSFMTTCTGSTQMDVYVQPQLHPSYQPLQLQHDLHWTLQPGAVQRPETGSTNSGSSGTDEPMMENMWGAVSQVMWQQLHRTQSDPGMHDDPSEVDSTNYQAEGQYREDRVWLLQEQPSLPLSEHPSLPDLVPDPATMHLPDAADVETYYHPHRPFMLAALQAAADGIHRQLHGTGHDADDMNLDDSSSSHSQSIAEDTAPCDGTLAPEPGQSSPTRRFRPLLPRLLRPNNLNSSQQSGASPAGSNGGVAVGPAAGTSAVPFIAGSNGMAELQGTAMASHPPLTAPANTGSNASGHDGGQNHGSQGSPNPNPLTHGDHSHGSHQQGSDPSAHSGRAQDAGHALGGQSARSPSQQLQLPFQQWMSQHAARLLLPQSMRSMADLFTSDMLWSTRHGGNGGLHPLSASVPAPTTLSIASANRDWPSMSLSNSAAPASISSITNRDWHSMSVSDSTAQAGQLNDQPAWLSANAASQAGRLGDQQIRGGLAATSCPTAPRLGPLVFKPPSGRSGQHRLLCRAGPKEGVDLLCGRYPSKAMRQLAADTSFISQLLAGLPGVDPHSAVVRSTLSTLAGSAAGLPLPPVGLLGAASVDLPTPAASPPPMGMLQEEHILLA